MRPSVSLNNAYFRGIHITVCPYFVQCRRPQSDSSPDDLLEKGMATLSSIIAWRFPWTEMPSRLQSVESQSQMH